MRDANANTEDLLRFRTSVSEADFLFRPDIPEYIDEIYKHGINLWRWNHDYQNGIRDRQKGYDHKKVVDEMSKELRWLSEQFEPAKQKFKKYLDISK